MMYTFNAILSKSHLGFVLFCFAKTDPMVLKFICKYKGPIVTKTILKKNKVGGLTFQY